MSKTRQLSKKQLTKLFFSYGLHLWIMVFVLNVAVFYVARYYSFGKTCITPTQVQSDNRCLYIMSGKVYEKGSRNAPHKGHPCGTDVTSVIPPSHGGNSAMYLVPNYVGDICTKADLEPTPKPQPTNPPIPTAVPTALPQPTAIPPTVAQPTTAQPNPSTSSGPSAPALMLPDASVNPFLAKPTGGSAFSALPTDDRAAVVQAPIVGPAIGFSFAIPGITTQAPVHTIKAVTINVYDQPISTDLQIPPTHTVTTTATYDADPASPTHSLFVVKEADLGASVSAGQYRIAFRTPQIPLTFLKTNEADTQATLFSLTPGTTAPEKPVMKNVLLGDLSADNVFTIQDYSIFVDCYGVKALQTMCTTPEAADLNDDGSIDGTDYILLLQSIKNALTQGRATLPEPTPSTGSGPTATPVPTLDEPEPPASPSALPLQTVEKPSPTVRKIISKRISVSPTVVPQETEVNGSSAITASQIITYLSLFLLLGVAIFGAFKSRLFAKFFGKKEEVKAPPPVAQPAPAPVVQAPATPSPPKQISRVYYVSSKGEQTPDGKFILTLTDDNGSVPGYTNQTPPADGYYSVSGFEENQNGAISITILTVTPALKPGTSF